jgi:hypothetical protein
VQNKVRKKLHTAMNQWSMVSGQQNLSYPSCLGFTDHRPLNTDHWLWQWRRFQQDRLRSNLNRSARDRDHVAGYIAIIDIS